MALWGADIGNAYLEAHTDEKVYIVAGPEFEELVGHILIIKKALYGLKSSGLRWAERLHDIMLELSFKPSKADPYVWYKFNKSGTLYEYVAIYVDDLLICADDPSIFISQLKSLDLKIKGEGMLSYHLGCEYEQNPDGTLVASPKKYISKILETYKVMFNEDPKQYRAPLDKNDHPELDNLELVDATHIQIYMTMIGQLQWAITLGRFDILSQVMSMSRFRLAPKQGHFDRVKRIYGYLSKTKHYAIRYRTDPPDYSNLPTQNHDWTRSVYGNVHEIIPDDTPSPKGKSVIMSTFVDANLMHDMITGRSVTAIFHFLNKTPIDWYSKRQATVETATYGSEFVAARTATEQIMDLHNTLRYLGVPIMEKMYMFGDNKSVTISSTIPQSILNKRHNCLAYHRVREAISANILEFHWIDANANKADILSKHWDFNSVHQVIKDLLDWRGPIKWHNEVDYGPTTISQSENATKGSDTFPVNLNV
jgi:hypothetical protein